MTFEVFVFELQRCQELQLGEQGYGRAPITVPKQAMVSMWYVGTPESFRSIADRFGISKSSVHRTCRRVSMAIVNNLMKRMIRWPSDEKRQQISEGFAE